MGSTRLPRKVLRDIAGKQILLRVVERVEQSKLVDQTIIVTSTILEHPKGVKGQSIELYPSKFVIHFINITLEHLRGFVSLQKKYTRLSCPC